MLAALGSFRNVNNTLEDSRVAFQCRPDCEAFSMSGIHIIYCLRVKTRRRLRAKGVY